MASSWRTQRGQASLALLATIPAMLVAGLVLAQVAVIGYSAWSASHAVRAAARADLVGAPVAAAGKAALPGQLGDQARIERRRGVVAVSLPVPELLPLPITVVSRAGLGGRGRR